MLVAPLILDLDGRVNLSVAGNRMKPVNLPPRTHPDDSIHTSGVGLGPWEIGVERLFAPNFTQEARNLVFQRGQAQTRPGPVLPTTQKWYASRYAATQHLPSYSKVPWAGFNAAAGSSLDDPELREHQPFATSPDYPGGCDCTNTLGSSNHPALFNPTEWPSLSGLGTPRGYSLADTKLLSVRYAFAPSFFAGLDLANFAPNSLRGSTAVPNPNPPALNTLNASRLDPAHTYRQLVTTSERGPRPPGADAGPGPDSQRLWRHRSRRREPHAGGLPHEYRLSRFCPTNMTRAEYHRRHVDT